MNAVSNMTQEQKDQLLARLLAKEEHAARIEKFKAAGLSWSTNGLITVKMPKVGDKNQTSLYINPSNVNHLAKALESIQEFAQTAGQQQ